MFYEADSSPVSRGNAEVPESSPYTTPCASRHQSVHGGQVPKLKKRDWTAGRMWFGWWHRYCTKLSFCLLLSTALLLLHVAGEYRNGGTLEKQHSLRDANTQETETIPRCPLSSSYLGVISWCWFLPSCHQKKYHGWSKSSTSCMLFISLLTTYKYKRKITETTALQITGSLSLVWLFGFSHCFSSFSL